MSYINHAMLIRREVITRIGKLLIDDTLVEKIDRIPLEMRPKNQFHSRCCIHKDRAVLKYKTMALLGFNIQDEQDELMPLSQYAAQAISRKSIGSKVLTVVDEACSACVKANYEVTNLCRGCVGRPCMFNCPKDAINVLNGKAIIDHTKCVNCGKCQKACPYHAIIYQPIPCEEACPVDAIRKNENGIEEIDEAKCINCGKCVTSCPFGAVVEKTHLVEIFKAFRSNKQVIAIPAPSIIGQFTDSYEKIRGAIKALGFDEIFEVAKGANQTTANESAEFIEMLEEKQPFMTTSCCPAYMQAVEKHIPELKPYVSHTKSPMHYAAVEAKKLYPESVIVFISPCTAKRSEAWHNEYVDYTLSFEELGALFIAKGIDVNEMEPYAINHEVINHGFGFGAVGGVTQSVLQSLPVGIPIKNIVIDGIDKSVVRQLKTFATGKNPGNFIEVMSCEGGCVGGPNVISNPKLAAKQLANYITNK
ncbi:MAG: 4Fe-4S binding protein [Salinivirgaceae bacterium]|nr:4Fe-4S binding protein [Salinivirgaceae bacterium]